MSRTLSQDRLDADLLEAAAKGKSRTLTKLIDQGAYINAVDDYGQTALILAAGR